MTKKLLTTSALLAGFLTFATGDSFAQSMTQVKKVASGIDDAEEAISGSSIGAMDLISSDLELSVDGSKNQLIGIRFTNINIPNGATIERAYIQFTNKGDKNPVSGDVIISAENTGNAVAFSSTNFDISSRALVGDSVVWTGSVSATWGTASGGASGAEQRTPNLKTIVQHVFDHAGWALGNSLAVIIKGNGVRNAFSYDGNPEGAPKLIIEYSGGAILPLEATSFPIEKGGSWKYSDAGTDLAETWLPAAFDDSEWSFGPALLGYGDNPLTTLSYGPSDADKYPAYYFRKHFIVDDASALTDSLNLEILRDDGAVVYINGTEVLRTNMPAGAITYSTLAATNVSDADETTYYTYRISGDLLTDGENVIAVELHQSATSSSDLSFDLSLKETLHMPVTTYPMAQHSPWKYLDNGTDLGTAYTASSYNDGGWDFGPGVLGYGDAADQATTLSYGPDAANKYPTTYFRKKIVISSLAALTDTINMQLLRDDGAVVYINGTEAVRSNMPATWDYLSYSAETVDGGAEDAYNEYHIPKSLFVADTNIIAVELHQRSASSSDISFDMSLSNYTPPLPPVACDPLPSDHISNFTSVLPSAQPDSLRIPSTHTFQMLIQDGTPYTDAGDGNTKGTFDFTAYIPSSGSSTDGHLSLNHEGSSWPSAGVSMMDISFNDSAQLWEITNNMPIDFSVVEGTGRNCSGGVTPWGTVITCEETLPSGDVNSDGYTDVGWAVEIDPAAKAIVDHDGDGQPDKLWHVGRMSHENVVVAADSITLYEGNDENPGFIFKFVADTAGKLGSGTLYALKLDGALGAATTGTWITVPNSTATECNNVKTFANANGATNFNQIEDVEISPLDGKIYFTSKSSGRVYRFKDEGTATSAFEIFVGDEATVYNIAYDGGSAGEQWRGGNDNLTFDDEGNLYVLQDGDRNHIWMVKPCHTQADPHVELFAVTPAGCEPTGMTFTPDFKYMFVSMQHPSSTNATEITDATGAPVKFNKESAIVIARNGLLGTSGPLPVSFISFDAVLNKDNQVALSWSFNNTGSDITRFEIQRMVLGGGFVTIKETTVTGNDPGKKHTALDEHPFIGNNLYRIKAIESSGKEVYTATEIVNVASAGKLAFAGLFPNPATGLVNIVLTSPAQTNVTVAVFNSLGINVLKQNSTLSYGNNKIVLNMSSLSSGMYQVRINNGQDEIVEKVIRK